MVAPGIYIWHSIMFILRRTIVKKPFYYTIMLQGATPFIDFLYLEEGKKVDGWEKRKILVKVIS